MDLSVLQQKKGFSLDKIVQTERRMLYLFENSKYFSSTNSEHKIINIGAYIFQIKRSMEKFPRLIFMY